jgi:hypothetical protein
MVYKVTDHTGAESSHEAVNEEGAVQAHLVHYGLLYLCKEPKVEISSGVPCKGEYCKLAASE